MSVCVCVCVGGVGLPPPFYPRGNPEFPGVFFDLYISPLLFTRGQRDSYGQLLEIIGFRQVRGAGVGASSGGFPQHKNTLYTFLFCLSHLSLT